MDYGQRHGAELGAARKIAKHLGAAEHRVLRIDLTQFAGQPDVRVQFYFDTLDAGYNNFKGVYLDNVNITNYTEN